MKNALSRLLAYLKRLLEGPDYVIKDELSGLYATEDLDHWTTSINRAFSIKDGVKMEQIRGRLASMRGLKNLTVYKYWRGEK